MKKLTLLFVALLCPILLFAQGIEGQWHGVLTIQGQPLRLVFHISDNQGTLKATMDSPDQHATGIPVTKITFVDSLLTLSITPIAMTYQGRLSGQEITGEFTQGTFKTPLNLSRQAPPVAALVRPQHPVAPYPYRSQEVVFKNPVSDLVLAGTLTLPEATPSDKLFPTAVLITGSGPQNRDEELAGHKPFLVLSDYLTRNGIAVLRVDDRGVGGSGGDFSRCTTADFATDVTAALGYLRSRKEVDATKIGVIGHSEGGMIAAMVAADSKDVAFAVMLAGTGVPGDSILLMQQKLIGLAQGVAEADLSKVRTLNRSLFQYIKKEHSSPNFAQNFQAYIRSEILRVDPTIKTNDPQLEKMAAPYAKGLNTPWMHYFISYDPAEALQKVSCPVLVLNGDKDLQVPALENTSAIQSALAKGGNKQARIQVLPGLNHLFQECVTGAPSEYGLIEQTFSPKALEIVAQWINEVTSPQQK